MWVNLDRARKALSRQRFAFRAFVYHFAGSENGVQKVAIHTFHDYRHIDIAGGLLVTARIRAKEHNLDRPVTVVDRFAVGGDCR